ncbi:MAG: hypothetical protein A2248_00870 [Candidatus Raymondbacteria bacterium RIFOXYA2_FULL_49_16]|uniref:Uncharacterized protein n=1 Tax=Candidatus Falkowbacteria bacterium RIFOXYC2_FULL_47_12 TaxID=1798004 RepID=A0A1F5TPY3_9BACT|nr:MAG: hypothetical protein A2477_03685 [Candidatus Falkowbacteria bacterium RIFOXYC2_FULL_47_12]OGJ88377.1 MAG: hypothetical protein A2248_00870 [Candidatus Raymondbacteria bacterium RIFOXYA2_FULL_49_16]
MIWNKSNDKQKKRKESDSFKGVGLLLLIFIAIFSWLAWFTIAKENTAAQAQTLLETGAGDGIAVRIMPNAEHVSPLEWYKKNIKQQGSPSRLLVDGYDALQEGRTVYVNTGNVVGDKLYTNIHIISYTQDASSDTKEIFNQLLNNWTFNTNIIADSQADFCLQIANNDRDPAGKKCYTDAQCGKNSGLYCNSLKARVTRDVRRLADLKEITTALDSYQAKNKDYPKLAAGSYLANKSISVWPSWQQTLGKELGKTLPTDPINKLVGCSGGYDSVTCWDEKNKKFNGTVPGGLPQGSHAYAYQYSKYANGQVEGKICALMESVVAINMVGGQACAGSNFNPIDSNIIISSLIIESITSGEQIIDGLTIEKAP